ncbi:SpoIID/LytB domain-containing protein [uncultured Eubacterium sp.]|uniref:SpoIID/LytB domain-containing protein n=1 Tax=uncultured Eubacterium sp. TaxID=165185 RepID=UPI0025EBB23E|nr:SpoIID/LytB domain-containing protein [uncultured Eubacterium sp.]
MLIIFVPYLLTVWVRGGFGGKQTDPVQTQIEEQLPFVAAREISTDSESECLKTQMIIARTNLWKSYQESMEEKSRSNEDAEWSVSDSGLESYTEEELKKLWGISYESNMEKLRQAVEETSGEILTYEDLPIQAAYHYAANCKTRNASEVPGQEDYIWLQSVDSEDDMLADGFLSVSYMEKQDIVYALAAIFQDEVLDVNQMPGALELSKRDSAGYVTEVTYGTTVANGEAVRQALHLNSACFYLSELDGKIRIVTKGIGHGLGLSQYGANELAKQGKNCREILNYYYTDVSIEKW